MNLVNRNRGKVGSAVGGLHFSANQGAMQSAASQSRRNISMGGGAVSNQYLGGGVYRPKTAAMPLGSLPRPPTVGGGGNALNFTGQNNFNRAKTANVPSTVNPRIKRYEEVIVRIKRLLG